MKLKNEKAAPTQSGLAYRLKSIPYSQKLAPYVFVGPFIILFALFLAYPIVSSVIMSFQKVLPGQTEFIGLTNYKNLINGDFGMAITNSVVYTVLTCIVLVPFPMLLAVMLDSKKMVGKGFFRAILFLPALVSIVVGGFTFRLIFGELPTALLNDVIGNLGMEPVKWLGGPAKWTTFFALLVLCGWRWMGVNVIYYLSGLQNISGELYESAEIDGANAWQKFWNISVPLLRPTAIYVLTISIYGGLAMFLESYMLFNGNRSPGGVGLTVVGYLYRMGWEQNNIGFAAAVGLCLLVVTLLINLVQLKITGFYEEA